MLDMPDRLVDQIRNMRIVQRVDDRTAASLTDDQAEMPQQAQLMRHRRPFHPDRLRKLSHAAGTLAQPRQDPHPARRRQRLHRLRHITRRHRVDSGPPIVSFDFVCHPSKIAEQMLRCSALRQALRLTSRLSESTDATQRYQHRRVTRAPMEHQGIPARPPAGTRGRELAAAGRIGDPAGMAKTYRLSPGTRSINSLFRGLTRLGLGASYRHILTVPGRKSGRLYSTPVDVIELADQRWLVAGYGPTNWVRNVRAAGEVTLSRGRQSQRFRVEEADRPAAVPVLRTYMREIRVTRPYFDASPDSADEDVAAELPRHAVFRLIPVVNGGRQTDAAR
jgi:deazaflavin-dependent oxidoreductase (nitroreductase family)